MSLRAEPEVLWRAISRMVVDGFLLGGVDEAAGVDDEDLGLFG